MSSKKPILFSTHMVQAIVDDRKSMTRRILKYQPEAPRTIYNDDDAIPILQENGEDLLLRFNWKTERYGKVYQDASFFDGRFNCPYGKVGDVLWVREEHYRYGHWESVWGVKTATGREKWMFIAETEEVRYFDNPPAEFRGGRHHKDPYASAWHKRLARFMPYKACRLFLQITDIRVERLQDISEADAIAEGVIQNRDGSWHDYIEPKRLCQDDARASFISLWESINGPGSWKRNDWVWVVSFQPTEKPC